MEAAQRADSYSAEEVVTEMQGAGMAPGPRAMHTLLFSYVKKGDSQGALEVAQRAAADGEAALPAAVTNIFHMLGVLPALIRSCIYALCCGIVYRSKSMLPVN